MQSEEITVETAQLKIPAELLAELSGGNAGRKTDYGVDAWKPSFLEWLAKFLRLI
ncbi:MAG TPA: hypothetical protein VEH54_08870 [Steroidobacteraceae bacterium]|nr:hypothetical protein [Steroidobacteraceae bacterium]